MRIIWAIFSLMYIGMAIFHFTQMWKRMPPFKNKGEIATINGLSVGVAEFVKEVNIYIGSVNKDAGRVNCLTGVSYLVAAAMALYSVWM